MERKGGSDACSGAIFLGVVCQWFVCDAHSLENLWRWGKRETTANSEVEGAYKERGKEADD